MIHFIGVLNQRMMKYATAADTKMDGNKMGKSFFPFPESKLEFLTSLLETYCNKQKWMPIEKLPEDDCERMAFLLDQTAYYWLDLEDWEALLYEVVEVAYLNMDPKSARDVLLKLQEVWLNGGWLDIGIFMKNSKQLCWTCVNPRC